MSENFEINPIIEDTATSDTAEAATEIRTRGGKHEKSAKKRMPFWLKTTIWILSIVISAVAISTVIIVGTAEYLGIGPGRGVKVVVEIGKGMSTRQIATELEESGAINNALAFRIFSKLKGYDGKYSYGVYAFNNEIGYNDLARKLMNEGAKAETVTVTIPEGTGINDYVKNVNGENVTVKGIATLLEEAGVCSRGDFLDAIDNIVRKSAVLSSADEARTYYTLEGYLFPDTYNFYSFESKECAVLAAEKMAKQMESVFSEDMLSRANELNMSVNEVLTLASIVQMESGINTESMADVAAVFHNRLKSSDFKTLGSSPTCYYGDSFRKDDGRYNTYNVEGLPPGPLCSPGLAAIKAALYPNDSSQYYYFVTDSDGKFYFHKTLAEQNVTINQLKQKGKWIYEYFNK